MLINQNGFKTIYKSSCIKKENRNDQIVIKALIRFRIFTLYIL